MMTSAPAACACRESRMASAVLVAPVCAITGTRPATWSTTISTTRRRSSLLSVLNSPVDPHATTPFGESRFLEAADRLAHRHDAGSHLRGQVTHPQPGSGRHLTVQDRLPDHGVDLIGQQARLGPSGDRHISHESAPTA